MLSYADFKVIAEREKEKRAVGEPFEKRAIEYSKASVEFSKILLTNIHLINAGSLLATPAIAKFLGYETLKAGPQTLILVLPPVFFLFGLVFAAFSALSTYRNFQLHAADEMYDRDRALVGLQLHFPLMPSESPYNSYEADVSKIEKAKRKNARAVQSTYVRGLGFGFASIGCFLAGCCTYAAVFFWPYIGEQLLSSRISESSMTSAFTLPMPQHWSEQNAYLLP
jgi:hypothetical protein